MSTSYRGLSAAIVVAAAVLASPTTAVTFNLRNTGGVTVGSNAYNGFAAAASYWASVLSDDVTINLDVGFRALSSGVLGSANSTMTTISTAAVVAALQSDATSARDMQAVANLPTLSAAGGVAFMAASAPIRNATTGLYSTTKVRDDNDSINNRQLALTSANAKALGFAGSTTDASIVFSSSFKFDFDPTNGIAANNYDFIGIATHEIGHALGFISGVDYYDYYTGKGPGAQIGIDLNSYAVGSPLDLFRYNRSASNNYAYTGSTPPPLDWTAGGTAFLSIDGGYTPLNAGTGNARFSTGTYNGNKRQASHWLDNSYAAVSGGCQQPATASLGLMDPTAARCEVLAVSSLDLAAFDIIGWDIAGEGSGAGVSRFTSAQIFELPLTGVNINGIPEPVTWAMLVMGFGGVGAMLRRRRAVIAPA